MCTTWKKRKEKKIIIIKEKTRGKRKKEEKNVLRQTCIYNVQVLMITPAYINYVRFSVKIKR